MLAVLAGIKAYKEGAVEKIILTRPAVGVEDEQHGFLPGDLNNKMEPWTKPLMDVILEHYSPKEVTRMLEEQTIEISPLAFMRGRTFLSKYLIIDEAQNLTPKQMKTLITRAGPGTKIICMGNIAQIDTPYLTEGSSGLTYAVDRFKGWPHGGHITLARGERSRLADFASEIL